MYGERLAEVMELVEEVAFRRLDERLAQLLIHRGPVLEATHQKLADELGSVREIVSRLLRGFEERGWVKLERERITVLDPGRSPALQATPLARSSFTLLGSPAHHGPNWRSCLRCSGVRTASIWLRVSRRAWSICRRSASTFACCSATAFGSTLSALYIFAQLVLLGAHLRHGAEVLAAGLFLDGEDLVALLVLQVERTERAVAHHAAAGAVAAAGAIPTARTVAAHARAVAAHHAAAGAVTASDRLRAGPVARIPVRVAAPAAASPSAIAPILNAFMSVPFKKIGFHCLTPAEKQS